MKMNSEIIDLFKDLESHSSINKVIEICQKIALSYLHYNYKKVYKFLKCEYLTLDELSIDAIVPLFLKDKSNENISIKSSFNNWIPSIKTDEDVLFFLNKVVASRVEQHLSSILLEEDPFFSKILDSVNYIVKLQGFKKIQSLGRSYIISNDYIVVDTLFIDPIEFEKIPVHLFTDKKKLLVNLLSYLENETNFVVAIPLNDLILRLKHINFADYIYRISPDIPNKKFEMDELVSMALDSTLAKLNNSYTLKGKLNVEESISISNALKDMCEDLMDGGINPGLFNYLSPYIKDLNNEMYKEKYHNIIEYLLKSTKSTIAENILEKK
jgi:hypothetical protein